MSEPEHVFETPPLSTSQRSSLLIISEVAPQMLQHFQDYIIPSCGWTISAYPSAIAALPQLTSEGPELVVLELTSTPEDARLVLNHAKMNWPQTTFLIFTAQCHLDPTLLIQTHGYMPTLKMPDIAVLCQATEEQMSNLSIGLIRGLTLPSLLQMFHWERKTIAVLVRHQTDWGRMHMRNGELVDAYVHSTGITGELAALEILSWAQVTLVLEHSYHSHNTAISWSLDGLLLEAARRQDETGNPNSPQMGNALSGSEFRETTSTQGSDRPAPPEGETTSLQTDSSPDDSTLVRRRPFPLLATAHPRHYTEVLDMANVDTTLDLALSSIDGAMAVALVDYNSGMPLGMAGTGLNLEIAAAGNTDVVRAKMRTMEALGIKGEIEDIMITLQTQYHVIFLIPDSTLFLYLVLSKDRANLAMARYKIKTLAAELKV